MPDGAFPFDDWLPYQFSFVANHVSRVLAKMYGEKFGLSINGWRIVAVLGSHAPLSAIELAMRTGVDQVSITRSINQLVDLRLVTRRVDSTDRRKIVLRLSRSGNSAYQEVLPLARTVESQLLTKLNGAQVKQLKHLMKMVFDQASVALAGDNDHAHLVDGKAAAEV